jgi:ribose transport system substrate-binding protein
MSFILKTTVMRPLLMAGAATLALGAASSTMAQDSTPVNKGADITTMCGTKPTKVALIDGYGSDTWRKITLAELRDEASKCKNIVEVRHVDAGGDQQKYNSDINSLVAQGYNIIIAFTDFGAAPMPAYRKAFKSGAVMVPWFNNLPGKIGQDYADNPYQDSVFVARQWADWYGKTMKQGNLVVLGGPPGVDSSKVFLDAFKEGMSKYPGLKLLDPNYIVTNWNPADGQKAVAGLIAKYPKIDGIASDYGVTTLAAIKAFEQAGLPVPAMATIASSNELNCKYVAQKKEGKAWKYLSYDGSTADIRFVLRRALAKFQGTKNGETRGIQPIVYVDSETGMDPKCDPAAPPDADLSSLLPADKLNALFKK